MCVCVCVSVCVCERERERERERENMHGCVKLSYLCILYMNISITSKT